MTAPLPIWIRLPVAKKDADGRTIEPARCALTGLSAAKLFNLSVPCRANRFAPKVRSITIPDGAEIPPDAKSAKRTKRKARYVRLINVASLLEYLDSLSDSAKEAA